MLDYHRIDMEVRERAQRRFGSEFYVKQYRYVCSCGHATRWSQDHRIAKKAMDRHALDGQRALPL